MAKDAKKLDVASPAFSEGGHIPDRYTCNGQEINPALEIGGIPQESKSLALTVDDPDAPAGVWDHWVVWNIQPSSQIAEGSVPAGAVQGRNSAGENTYQGPCPPSGTHRYRFNVYALDVSLTLREGSSKADLEEAMSGHILALGTLTGLYSKK